MKPIFKNSWLTVIALLFVFTATASKPKDTIDLNKISLIPQPVSVIYTGKVFMFTYSTGIFYQEEKPSLRKSALFLANILRPSTGLPIPVISDKRKPHGEAIYLALRKNPILGNEGYELRVTRKRITLIANKPAGIFRGIQTIRQLLPSKVEKRTLQQGPWIVPTVRIEDYPSYAYRGAMLDVARHFFGVKTVEKIHGSDGTV